MKSLFDILLESPLSRGWVNGLLFATFTLHLLFVLLTLGTAILAFYLFLHAWRAGRSEELRWDKEVLKTFMAHKSLAVVLGVAPLLLIQVGYTIPFFTGLNLFAPFWMLIIILLVAAFLSFDILGHQPYTHPRLHLVFGIFGLACLLAVPGIFVAVLLTGENYGQWRIIAARGFHLAGPLAPYWLFRYLHVLGASIVFGAAFHYFFTAEGNEENKKAFLMKWIVGGILLQIILGVLLYGSLARKPDFLTNFWVVTGVFFALALLWVLSFSASGNKPLNMKGVFPLLLLILLPMLLARQYIQDQSFLPLSHKLRENALAYEKNLETYKEGALNAYRSRLRLVYDRGETIYGQSCAFCHGARADGHGVEADKLAIPPEQLSAIRTTRPYFHKILIEGVEGTAMPYFSFFDRNKLNRLIDDLEERYSVIGLPERVPVALSARALEGAEREYSQTCSVCHGLEGRGTKLSRNFKPQPPDFAVYSLSPQRSFEVITHGYPGTMMTGFSSLPEDLRWGLVMIVGEKRKP